MTAKQSPMVFIVLGVFNPNLDLLEQQLQSLLGQTYNRFEVLLVCDGPSAAEAISLLTLRLDERFEVLPHSDTVGAHANFGRGLNAALAKSQNEHDLFAFCDQDDVWYPEKLAVQVDSIRSQPDCGLCHCDARVVDASGQVVAASMFSYEKRSQKPALLDLLVMNSVTGMTLVATKSVASSARGFPMKESSKILHDHWLALVAAAQSRVVFLDVVLVDYVQHDANQLGARHQSIPRMPMYNLLFGGKEYWQRCKRQYSWRRQAIEALGNTDGTSSRKLRTADLQSWLGAARLLRHMISAQIAGESRQAAQSWRLLAGKVLGLYR